MNKLNRGGGGKPNADKAVGATFLLKDLFGRGRVDGKVSIDTHPFGELTGTLVELG